jgi:hypothetical protein
MSEWIKHHKKILTQNAFNNDRREATFKTLGQGKQKDREATSSHNSFLQKKPAQSFCCPQLWSYLQEPRFMSSGDLVLEKAKAPLGPTDTQSQHQWLANSRRQADPGQAAPRGCQGAGSRPRTRVSGPGILTLWWDGLSCFHIISSPGRHEHHTDGPGGFHRDTFGGIC